MMIKNLFFLGLVLASLTFSCTSTPVLPSTPKVVYPENFQKVLDAHGGLEHWQKMKSLAFTLQRDKKVEQHQVDFPSRRSRIEDAGRYVLGFDGKEVWVTPHRDSFPGSSPRFYHNLHFYFFAVPFVFADPGVTIKDAGLQKSGDQEYRLLQATFGEGVGDAPDDEYNMYVDPLTNKVVFINYTVTYFDQAKGTRYNALKFVWEEVNGILVPQSYTGHKWAEGALQEERFTYHFTNTAYSEKAMDVSLYTIPEGAYIDRPTEE